MNQQFDIPTGERGIIRVFKVNLPDPEAHAFTQPPEDALDEITQWPLKMALGATHLDPAQVTSFQVSDLAGVGLATYLQDGQGAVEIEIEAARADLDAISGRVVVIRSAAFGGNAQSLNPQAPLQFVGAFAEEGGVQESVPLPGAEANPQPTASAPTASSIDDTIPEGDKEGLIAPISLGLAALILLVLAVL